MMTLLWTTPRVWQPGESIDKAKMNAISNNLRFLYNPPAKQWTTRGTSVAAASHTTTSGGFISDDWAGMSNIDLTLEITGLRDIYLHMIMPYQNNTATARTTFDVYYYNVPSPIVTSGYVSSGVTWGLWSSSQFTAGTSIVTAMRGIIPKGTLPAGTYVFRPMWFVGAGTATLLTNANNFMHFKVGEF